MPGSMLAIHGAWNVVPWTGLLVGINMRRTSSGSKRETASGWIRKIQPEVAYCLNCQPHEDGESVWVQGDKQDMEDLLMEFHVPETLRDDVARGLNCQNCGCGLDRGSDIGRKTAEEREWDAMHAEWRRKYEPKLNDFVRWMTNHPYLGLHHELGRQFMEEIPTFPTRRWNKDQMWHRARAVWGAAIPSLDEMGPPTEAPPCEGRFSHHGQIVFYLADSQKTAAAEAIGKRQGIAWVQQFRIGQVERLLDLNSVTFPSDVVGIPILAAGMNWTRALSTEPPNSSWKPQYFLPRFIADCARACGHRGLIYPSTRFYGECLVLFDWAGVDIKPVDSPVLFQWSREAADKEMPF